MRGRKAEAVIIMLYGKIIIQGISRNVSNIDASPYGGSLDCANYKGGGVVGLKASD